MIIPIRQKSSFLCLHILLRFLFKLANCADPDHPSPSEVLYSDSKQFFHAVFSVSNSADPDNSCPPEHRPLTLHPWNQCGASDAFMWITIELKQFCLLLFNKLCRGLGGFVMVLWMQRQCPLVRCSPFLISTVFSGSLLEWQTV